MRNVIKSVEVRYYAYASGLSPVFILEFEDGTYGTATMAESGHKHKDDLSSYRNSETLGRAVEVLQDRIIEDLQDRTVEARTMIEQIEDWIANRKDRRHEKADQ